MNGEGDRRWVSSQDRSVAEIWRALGLNAADGDRLQKMEARLLTLAADIKAIKDRLAIP